MNPTIVALFGLLKGSSFHWSDAEFSIGRDPSCSLCINDPLVSREHCVITKTSDGFLIQDLDSRNGLFVGNIPVKRRVLHHGDQITIGDSLFLFLLQEEEETPSRESLEEQEIVSAGSTTELRLDEALYLNPAKFRGSLPSASRMERDLSLLLKASSVFQTLRNVQDLLRTLLELSMEAVPAERSAVLLASDIASDCPVPVTLQRRPDSENFSISRTISAKVATEGIAILCNDIERNKPIHSRSLISSSIHSILCVPIMRHDNALGIVYLDTKDSSVRFDDGHLQLIASMAGLAGLALKTLEYMRWLEEEKDRLQIEIVHDLIGESLAMQKIYQMITKVAQSDSTVLICGESGTGKELVARALHKNSPRQAKPFIPINCAVLVESLFESEVFGHEKGAFTGAIAQKIGKLEIANGGTVFLDEISEIPASVQAKLLRVIQELQFERVGGTRSIQVDVRWIAASNKNLDDAIRDGTFRRDLFYRLNVVNMNLPPLRERLEDIPLLTNYFVAKYSKQLRRRVKGASEPARERLLRYDWPGNVRELENAIERAIVLGSEGLIQVDDLPETLLELEPASRAQQTGYHAAIREAKKQLVLNALQQTKGNYTEAAKLLGVHPTYLHRLIRNLNLKSVIKC